MKTARLTAKVILWKYALFFEKFKKVIFFDEREYQGICFLPFFVILLKHMQTKNTRPCLGDTAYFCARKHVRFFSFCVAFFVLI